LFEKIEKLRTVMVPIPIHVNTLLEEGTEIVIVVVVAVVVFTETTITTTQRYRPIPSLNLVEFM
jgi:hypothetical protein